MVHLISRCFFFVSKTRTPLGFFSRIWSTVSIWDFSCSYRWNSILRINRLTCPVSLDIFFVVLSKGGCGRLSLFFCEKYNNAILEGMHIFISCDFSFMAYQYNFCPRHSRGYKFRWRAINEKFSTININNA